MDKKKKKQIPKEIRRECLCGCGKIPKGKDSSFLPGHDLKLLVKSTKGTKIKNLKTKDK